jgi:large subunit ribosomal protein L35
MPKIKSHSGAKKRFRISATGKVRYKKSHARHILTKKKTKKLRTLRKSGILNLTDSKMVKKLIPYV